MRTSCGFKGFVFVVVVLVCLFSRSGFGQPWVGSGDANDPYQIWDANDMQAIGAESYYWGSHFKLMADIDLGVYTGTSFNIIGTDEFNRFTGVFDGDGHTISNFTYDCDGIRSIGVFGYIDDPNAEIRDLGLIDPNVNAGSGSRVGPLAGYLRGGTISGCYVEGGSVTGGGGIGGLVGSNSGDIQVSYSTGDVTGAGGHVGGLVGFNNHGDIQGCYSTGSVTGEEYVGGLVGNNDSDIYYGDITDCYSTGDVTGQGYAVGGLVGYNSDSNIQGCYSTGGVIGDSPVGGLVGRNYYGDMSGCYSTGSVTGGGNYVGGLVGHNHSRDDSCITDCYSTGEIDGGGNFVGGLVGDNSSGGIQGCYSTGSVTGEDYVGGLVGRSDYVYIQGCYSTGEVVGEGYVGGLAGYAWDIQDSYSTSSVTGEGWFVGGLVGQGGAIFNCYSTGGVTGEHYVGGLVGDGVGIKGCYSTGDVTGQGYIVGGLVGCNSYYYSYITSCYSIGNVTAEGYAGGLVGFNEGDIKGSYSTGGVAASSYVGGLVGLNSGDIQMCYSAGSVTGDSNIGGLVGDDYKLYGDYTACFWDSDVNPDVNGIGNMDDPNVTGLPTVDMQEEGTFTGAGWDFVTPVWKMCDLPDYPKLAWQLCPIEVEMEVTPAMLNCASSGDFVEAHFVLPEGYLPEDIDINTPAVAEPVGVESEAIEVLDEGDGYYRIVAVFDREAFCEALGDEEEKELEVTVIGSFTDGAEFYGTDTIKLISDHWRHRKIKN